MHYPAARRDDLVASESPDGTLVYDTRSHHIHHLNPVAAAIWRACDGRHSPKEIAARVSGTTGELVPVEAISSGLTLLANAGLLAGETGTQVHAARQSRRTLLKRAAMAGAVPAIVSVTAATAGDTGSETSPNCTPAGQACVQGPTTVCCDHPTLGPTECLIAGYTLDPNNELVPFYRCITDDLS